MRARTRFCMPWIEHGCECVYLPPDESKGHVFACRESSTGVNMCTYHQMRAKDTFLHAVKRARVWMCVLTIFACRETSTSMNVCTCNFSMPWNEHEYECVCLLFLHAVKRAWVWMCILTIFACRETSTSMNVCLQATNNSMSVMCTPCGKWKAGMRVEKGGGMVEGVPGVGPMVMARRPP